jgi:hypothetical protein
MPNGACLGQPRLSQRFHQDLDEYALISGHDQIAASCHYSAVDDIR